MIKKEMHEANCWECRYGAKGKPGEDGAIPLTCSNDNAAILNITESVTLCNAFEHEHKKDRWEG